MIALARKNLAQKNVNFTKINGEQLPFENKRFDIVFSATVLQHNTDEMMMEAILKEMCRVSKDRVVLFERVEKTLKGDELCMGRPVEYYANICREQGFTLVETKFINIQVSYLVSGAIRKMLNPNTRKEGQPLTPFATWCQKASLPLTKVLDKVFTSRRDLAKLEFRRK
jgi:hypothetical protein